MRFLVVVGSLLLLAGLSLLLNAMFGLAIPLFRIGVAVLLIWWGLALVLRSLGIDLPGSAGARGPTLVATSQAFEPSDASDQYTVLFGQGFLDARDAVPEDGIRRIGVNAIFGEVVVLYDADTPMRVRSSAAFGRVTTPNGSPSGFGQGRWTSDEWTEEGPGLELQTSAVFGEVRFERADAAEIAEATAT